MKQLTSSIVICTRNRLNDILHLLPSILTQISKPQECVIVDASDTPLDQNSQFSTLFNTANFPTIKLTYHHTKKAGLTLQRNMGIALASTDIVHFLDDDTILEPHYIGAMNTVFQEHADYAGGMGCVTNVAPKPNNIHMQLRSFFMLQRDYASGNFTLSGMPTHAYGTTEFKPVHVLGGCCMSYRRAIIADHLFDETLGQYAYLEDADAAWRVSRAHKLFYNPAAKLIHLKSPINRYDITKRRALFIKNYSYLFFKNIYPHNKFKILAYLWSVFGLFCCALLTRDIRSFKGYWHGLKLFYGKE